MNDGLLVGILLAESPRLMFLKGNYSTSARHPERNEGALDKWFSVNQEIPHCVSDDVSGVGNYLKS